MAIKKSDLYSSLWASCDELRGGMDASQYKDYVLFMLFIKYISDKYGDSDDFAPPVTIPKGASFKDMVALQGKSDIGDKINKQVIQPLIDAKQFGDVGKVLAVVIAMLAGDLAATANSFQAGVLHELGKLIILFKRPGAFDAFEIQHGAIGAYLPASSKDLPRLKRRLVRAGIRNPIAPRILQGARAVATVACCSATEALETAPAPKRALRTFRTFS